MKIIQRPNQLILEYYPVRGWFIFCIFSGWAIAFYDYPNPVEQSMALWIASILVVLFAAFWGFNLQSTVWELDSLKKTLTIYHYWIWNKKIISEEQYQWVDIASVRVVHGDESLFSVEIATHSRQLLLCPDYSLFLKDAEKGEEAIATFLNLASSLAETDGC